MSEPVSSSGKPIRYGAYPEITVPAVVVGYGLGILIALSIVINLAIHALSRTETEGRW